MTRRLDLSREPTPAEIRRARENYLDGVPLQEVARQLGRGPSFASALLADIRAAKRAERKKFPRHVMGRPRGDIKRAIKKLRGVGP